MTNGAYYSNVFVLATVSVGYTPPTGIFNQNEKTLDNLKRIVYISSQM